VARLFFLTIPCCGTAHPFAGFVKGWEELKLASFGTIPEDSNRTPLNAAFLEAIEPAAS
jgi:hypothetical protein